MLARPLPFLALLLALALVAVGCGSDDSSSSDSKDSSSKTSASESDDAEDDAEDEAEDAEDATKAAYSAGLIVAATQLEEAGTAVEQSTDWASFSAGLQQVRESVNAFAELTPPADVAAEHEDMVASLRTAVSQASKVTETSDEASDQKAMAAASTALDEATSSADSILAQLND